MSTPPTRPRWSAAQLQGILAALLSGVVLGLPPIFGKQAILAGTPPLTVVMLRTVLSAGVLWLLYSLFWRRYLYIYPAGLLACLLAGLFNGLGSLMFYTGLGRLDASQVQLIFTLNTLFLTFISWLDGYPVRRFTLFRLGLALFAVYLLTVAGAGPHSRADWGAAVLVLASALMYAMHVAVNQHVLFDMPAPTVALYTLSAMATTTSVAYLLVGLPAMPHSTASWQFVLLLTLATTLSRLALFTGVKQLGGVQAALLGLAESLVTLSLALLFLGERLTPVQWLGAGLLATALLLIVREQSLGALPRPKPWLQMLAAWNAERLLRRGR